MHACLQQFTLQGMHFLAHSCARAHISSASCVSLPHAHPKWCQARVRSWHRHWLQPLGCASLCVQCNAAWCRLGRLSPDSHLVPLPQPLQPVWLLLPEFGNVHSVHCDSEALTLGQPGPALAPAPWLCLPVCAMQRCLVQVGEIVTRFTPCTTTSTITTCLALATGIQQSPFCPN